MGLRQFAQETPEKAAFIIAETGEATSYADLDRRLNQYAQFFRKQGLQVGDGISLTLENCVELMSICGGANRAGLYFTPLSTYLSAAESVYIVKDSGAGIYICSARYAERGAAVARLLDDTVQLFSLGGEIEGFTPLEGVVDSMPASPIADETKGQDLLYSSGTTGQPKGVRVELTGESPEHIAPNGLAVIHLYGYSQDTVYLSPAPLYHAAPLRFTGIPIAVGGTSVIMQKFDPESALRYIEEYRCTHSQWVPTMLVRMLKLPSKIRESYDVSSMRVGIHASAPCPIPVKEQMIDWWGEIIYEYYAGSEGNGFCAISSQEWLAHRGSVGRPLFGAIHILDENDDELPTGEPGTIFFAGGTDFEYLNDPEKTKSAHNAQGWSTLGDIGYLDSDGYLYLSDRKAYMIISGGVNVYPQETENLLVMHPAVEDVAVFGIPDEDLGEQVKAVVQLCDPAQAGEAMEQELIAYCRERLSHIKCPRSVDFTAELPRQATGKLYKRLLRDKYWSQESKSSPQAMGGD